MEGVAGTGAVGWVVVFPENLDLVSLTCGDLARDLDQVRGIRRRQACASVRVGAGDVIQPLFHFPVFEELNLYGVCRFFVQCPYRL